MSREKIFHLKAMGAEVVLTRSDVGKGHPDYYQDMAARIAAETPARSSSTSSATRPIRSRTNWAPDRRSSSSLTARSTRWSAASAPAAR